MPSFIKSHPILTILLAFVLAFAALVATAALRKDFVVRWDRSVPSSESTVELGRALDDLTQWPIFHHGLKEAGVREANGHDLSPPESRLLPGATLRYEIVPPGREWKRFEILAQVKAYNPHRKLELGFLSESTGKLEKVFDDLHWSVEIEEAPAELKQKGFTSLVHGTAEGRTKSWRARLFGMLSPRILMNQVYTIDLVKLGSFDRQKEAKEKNFAPNYQ